MFGFEQLSVVDVSLSVQSEADLHLILHILFEQEEFDFPGLLHTSFVMLFESSQAASELHEEIEPEFESERVCVQDEDSVPGLVQTSVVSELLSLHALSALQAMLQFPDVFTMNSAAFFRLFTV